MKASRIVRSATFSTASHFFPFPATHQALIHDLAPPLKAEEHSLSLRQ
jgi:hypothetical protein